MIKLSKLRYLWHASNVYHYTLTTPFDYLCYACCLLHSNFIVLMAYRISLVFWATELYTSLSSSICQPASICRYRARGLSLFRGDKVKMVIEVDDLPSSMTYRARWPIELGFSREEKKREKMEIKAIITTWSTKSKTPSRSQFVTDKKHCVAGRLMMF